MHSLDAIEFANNMKINSSWILKEFQTLFEEKLFKRIFENGKNNKLSNTVSNILDYTIELQPDFKLIKSDSINSFIWLGRGYPYRWLILYKAKKDDYINVDSSWIKLKNDFAVFIPDIIITDNFSKNEKVSYGQNKIPVMRGIYEHLESNTGGPFFVYMFDTEVSNEVILISGFVNYPGHEKLLLLKQLEIMAKTFHKGESI